jgi:spore coat protein U-like protein
MMNRWIGPAVVGLLLCAAPGPASAAINCSISTVGMAFGSYNVFSGSALSSTGSVTIQCTGVGAGVDPVTVSLNPGTGGSFQPRKMFKGIETLSYNLYLDAGGNIIWGDGTGGTQQFASVSNNRAVTLTIFGRIPPGQDVSVGTYTDTIVATINF